MLVYRVEIAFQFPPPFRYAQLYGSDERNDDLLKAIEFGGHAPTVPGMRSSSKTKSATQANATGYDTLATAGMSLSAALHLLKDTHDLLHFPTTQDAVFVHKSVSRSAAFQQSTGGHYSYL